MLKNFTCIMCPRGCDLEVEFEEATKSVHVSGNSCKKGEEYAVQELLDPKRNIASSVLVEGGELPLVSVRLSKPIPRNQIFPVMDEIKKVKVQAPVQIGQVIIPDVLGLGSDVLATKNILKV